MTINDVLNAVKEISGATMARVGKTNFIVVPCEDGIAKIDVKTALGADTKNHKAFNMEAATAEYKAWETAAALREAERAAKPKVQRGPNPEAQARRDELDAKVAGLPNFTDYTATDILAALKGQVADNVMAMHVGSSAKRLTEKGVLVASHKDGDKKTYYTKA